MPQPPAPFSKHYYFFAEQPACPVIDYALGGTNKDADCGYTVYYSIMGIFTGMAFLTFEAEGKFEPSLSDSSVLKSPYIL